MVIDQVSVAYDGPVVLREFSLEVERGSIAVMGPSGSGKSTLLRVVGGKQQATSGTVTLDGSAIEPVSWRSSGDGRISMIFQDYRLVSFLTVRDNIALAAEARGSNLSDADIDEALDRVGLPSEFIDRFPGSLSGGEQQRVAIARALVTNARVLLADEPTGALDAKNSERISSLLKKLAVEGLIVIVATHDASVAARMDRIVDLEEGAKPTGESKALAK